MVSIPLLTRGIAAIGFSLTKRQESKRSCSERVNVVQLASGSGMLGRIPPHLRYDQTVYWSDATVPRLGMFCFLALRLSPDMRTIVDSQRRTIATNVLSMRRLRVTKFRINGDYVGRIVGDVFGWGSRVGISLKAVCVLGIGCILGTGYAWAEDSEIELQKEYRVDVAPIVQKFCTECHNADVSEADIDFASIKQWSDVKKEIQHFQRALDQLRTNQMPPPDSPQLSDIDARRLSGWIERWLALEAAKQAGDPGPVVLRRLNNAEYTYTLRDLTGVPELDPAKEFPVDSAAGEGFSNTGASLVMSPALVRKYLDAAKRVAEHLVLLPDGFVFSANPSASDMTNQKVDEIRKFYARYANNNGGDTVNLQGIVFETNQGGRLPIEQYLAAADDLRRLTRKSGGPPVDVAIETIAKEKNISPKYLRTIWQALAEAPRSSESDGLLSNLSRQWQERGEEGSKGLLTQILAWQKSLWRFTSVGHIGKRNGPTAWQEPVDPIRAEHELRFPIPDPKGSDDVTIYLQVTDAGDGSSGDVAYLERPRLVAPGRPDLLLRDLNGLVRAMDRQRETLLPQIDETLNVIDSWLENQRSMTLTEAAKSKGLDPEFVNAWAGYLGVLPADGSASKNQGRLMQPGKSLSEYEFIKGWAAEDALSIIANSSEQQVRIPGNMLPKSIAVHPSPSKGICVSWRAPNKLIASCKAIVKHAHTECGNGIAWRLELRRGALRQILAAGFSNGANIVPIGPFESLLVREGEHVVLVVEPRDGNHSCDLTTIDLEIASAEETWNLTRDVSGDILAGNPHADSKGRADVWEFFGEPVSPPNRIGGADSVIPTGSSLASWLNEPNMENRKKQASRIEQLVQSRGEGLNADSADAVLVRQILSSSGPFFAAAMSVATAKPEPAQSDATDRAAYGLEAGLFGPQPNGVELAGTDYFVASPGTIAIRVPASLAANTELVTTGRLHPVLGRNGSVQFSVGADAPKPDAANIPTTTIKNQDPNWTNPSRQVLIASPIVVIPNSDSEARIRKSFAKFRELFPIALCYTKIVPVDEVVTLTLFYREDDALQRLMLSELEVAELNRLWDELHFVSQDALKSVDAYEQLWQFATQDADPSAFEPLREPLLKKAEAFRQQKANAESAHWEEVLRFAERAFRRPITQDQKQILRSLYDSLRGQETPHDDAIRLVVARILVSPEFLYRTEIPGESDKPTRVSAIELANRLSYFLWASAPDRELLELATNGSLQNPEVLEAQVRRMLRDPRIERMAVEFGCMWLHIRDLDQLDEKSESHFPEFAALRADLYKEAILFIADMLRSDGEVMDMLNADHTFLNESLAKFYGFDSVSGDQWQRVEGIRKSGRGGILALGATLAKQSGASRTSPILRGNWLSEVVLGEKLPKPPKNVPVLSETPPAGMTERQLIEKHSSDPGCAKCHQRIDPFGFALEAYDAIGRFRTKDSLGLDIRTETKLPDGTEIRGLDDLREYLSERRGADFRKQFNRKLLGYALGRSVQLSDEPLLSTIAKQQENNDRISDTIVAIVLSEPFRSIRGRDYREE